MRTRSSKSSVCFPLIAHLQLDQPYFKGYCIGSTGLVHLSEQVMLCCVQTTQQHSCLKHQKYISRSSYTSFACQQGSQAPSQHTIIVNKDEMQELSTSYQVHPPENDMHYFCAERRHVARGTGKCSPITCPES